MPRSVAAGAGAAVDLGELVFGVGEADFQAFGFAEPAFAFGFGDVGARLSQISAMRGPRGGIWPVHGVSQAVVLVAARGCGCWLFIRAVQWLWTSFGNSTGRSRTDTGAVRSVERRLCGAVRGLAVGVSDDALEHADIVREAGRGERHASGPP